VVVYDLQVVSIAQARCGLPPLNQIYNAADVLVSFQSLKRDVAFLHVQRVVAHGTLSGRCFREKVSHGIIIAYLRGPINPKLRDLRLKILCERLCSALPHLRLSHCLRIGTTVSISLFLLWDFRHVPGPFPWLSWSRLLRNGRTRPAR